ncbi:AAA family ATPase [Priestia filamentosa]|uniref:AAA family ATPase n=1 Tax=Priestia filamentosa TaxID=1402861 RepID=UPI0005892239
MSKLIYMIGLPGSGKSTVAKEVAKKERAVILSTDELRREMFYSETSQKKTNLLYYELFRRVEIHLAQGRNVIIDATNTERGYRMLALKHLKATQKECYYLNTPYEVCLKRNRSRKRKVEEYILLKMYKQLDFPILSEGWDQIHIVHDKQPYNITKEKFTSLLESKASYEELFKELKEVPIFRTMYQFNQENPFHSMPLCQHTYGVLEYINELYEEKDKLIMQIAALLHDVEKPTTKKFKELKGHYSYYGHERASAHFASHFLTELGFEADMVMKVANLIQMHMKINYGGEEGANEIYHLLGDEMLWKLYFFLEADKFAK